MQAALQIGQLEHSGGNQLIGFTACMCENPTYILGERGQENGLCFFFLWETWELFGMERPSVQFAMPDLQGIQ